MWNDSKGVSATNLEKDAGVKVLVTDFKNKYRVDDNYYDLGDKYDFSEICITSTADVSLDKKLKEEISVETFKAEGEKCNICWKITKGKCERCSNL